MEEIGKEIIWILLVALAFDFFQQVLGGVLNALGKQTWALFINLITYCVFVGPLAYYFAFEYGEHE